MKTSSPSRKNAAGFSQLQPHLVAARHPAAEQGISQVGTKRGVDQRCQDAAARALRVQLGRTGTNAALQFFSNYLEVARKILALSLQRPGRL